MSEKRYYCSSADSACPHWIWEFPTRLAYDLRTGCAYPSMLAESGMGGAVRISAIAAEAAIGYAYLNRAQSDLLKRYGQVSEAWLCAARDCGEWKEASRQDSLLVQALRETCQSKDRREEELKQQISCLETQLEEAAQIANDTRVKASAFQDSLEYQLADAKATDKRHRAAQQEHINDLQYRIGCKSQRINELTHEVERLKCVAGECNCETCEPPDEGGPCETCLGVLTETAGVLGNLAKVITDFVKKSECVDL